jgi:hypothetical protein
MVGWYRILRDMHRMMEETVVVPSCLLDRAVAQHTAEEDTVAVSCVVVGIVVVALRDIVVVVVVGIVAVCCGLHVVVGVAPQVGVG